MLYGCHRFLPPSISPSHPACCLFPALLQRDHGAISIVDADVNVDFDTPADYVEPERKPRPAPKLESFQDHEMPEVEPSLPSGCSIPHLFFACGPCYHRPALALCRLPRLPGYCAPSADGVKAFTGSGARPNGKAVDNGDTAMQLDATAKGHANKVMR